MAQDDVDAFGFDDEGEDAHVGAAAGQRSGNTPQMRARRRAQRERAAVADPRWAAAVTLDRELGPPADQGAVHPASHQR